MVRRTKRRSCAGFTLFELLVVMGLFGSLLGTLAVLARQSGTTTVERASENQVRRATETTLARIVTELGDASRGGLVPDPVDPFWVDRLDYQAVSRLDAGGVTYSAVRRLALVDHPADPPNGLDDDGDGVIDPRVLQLTTEDGERTVTLSSHVRAMGAGEVANGVDDDGDGLVDEAGFCVTRDGRSLRVELTLERPDSSGGTALATAVARAWLQNE